MNASKASSAEEQRIATLKQFEILDTPPEESFDAIVKLTASICETPICLISLVDEARQWFKAKVGLEADQTPREIAFCPHTIQGTDILTVPDALADDRFRDNPLVVNDPNIRFYAGMPLITSEGFAIGTLCVIDRAPREGLIEHQRQSLRLLAREVVLQLELRRTINELNQARNTLHSANVELEAFGAAVAHDLRAPLRHIDGFAAMLAEQLPNDLSTYGAVDRIRGACAQAQNIIDALLALSRVSKAAARRRALNISDMMRELCDELSSLEPHRRFQFTIEPNMVVQADAALARILLTNLLSNAIKFARTRPVTQIVFSRRATPSGQEYSLRDNGIGFDANTPLLPARPFVRRHAASEFEGVGLGLTIVQRIVTLHGGALRAESSPDGGAVFYFTLGDQETTAQ